MKIQKINQSSIYQIKNRQDGTVNFQGECRPKPKSNYGRGDFSMPSFKSRVGTKQAKTLMQEVGTLVSHTYNSIAESFNKSKTKKILVAPTRKLWSDFKSVAAKQVDKMDSKLPTASPIIKGAAATTAAAFGLDAIF